MRNSAIKSEQVKGYATPKEKKEFEIGFRFPNETTKAAIKEADRIVSGSKKSKKYNSARDMAKDILG